MGERWVLIQLAGTRRNKAGGPFLRTLEARFKVREGSTHVQAPDGALQITDVVLVHERGEEDEGVATKLLEAMSDAPELAARHLHKRSWVVGLNGTGRCESEPPLAHDLAALNKLLRAQGETSMHCKGDKLVWGSNLVLPRSARVVVSMLSGTLAAAGAIASRCMELGLTTYLLREQDDALLLEPTHNETGHSVPAQLERLSHLRAGAGPLLIHGEPGSGHEQAALRLHTRWLLQCESAPPPMIRVDGTWNSTPERMQGVLTNKENTTVLIEDPRWHERVATRDWLEQLLSLPRLILTLRGQPDLLSESNVLDPAQVSRLRTFEISLPPMRERRGEALLVIPRILGQLVSVYKDTFPNTPVHVISFDHRLRRWLEALVFHPLVGWRGNFDQLEALVSRIVFEASLTATPAQCARGVWMIRHSEAIESLLADTTANLAETNSGQAPPSWRRDWLSAGMQALHMSRRDELESMSELERIEALMMLEALRLHGSKAAAWRWLQHEGILPPHKNSNHSDAFRRRLQALFDNKR